ncbi:MAG: guanine deaminase [Alteromonadaceae bacterium]|nr:guanine deaminase [Alteromonadaceae bacterium]
MKNNQTETRGYRGRILHFLDEPGTAAPEPGSYQFFEDGLLIVDQDRILVVGHASDLLPSLPAGAILEHWPEALIVPGFIDTHVHMPQLQVIASFGSQLLDWLETYTYPAEARFADAAWARSQAEVFVDMMLAHGTTSALVFATSHATSVNALFTVAAARRMAIATGKVMMDRNAPQALCDRASGSCQASQALIDRWHGKDRLRYAVTPRFAITSSPEQLSLAGKLVAENPGVLMQTHWAENHAEIDFACELYPERKDYLDVYEHYGLLGERSVLAHGVHINEHDRHRLNRSGSRIAFCPTSNTFLGSGLFDFEAARGAGVNVGLATDVGAGTSLSMLATMAEAYKVCQLQGQTLSPFQAFYLSTLGNARVLHQDADSGNFEPGKYADFVVLDPSATPILRLKQHPRRKLADVLFDLMILGDDRCIKQTYVAGQCQFDRATT